MHFPTDRFRFASGYALCELHGGEVEEVAVVVGFNGVDATEKEGGGGVEEANL